MSKMIAETFTCSMEDGSIQYGYTFKHEGSDDCEFDIVLGTTTKFMIINLKEFEKFYDTAQKIAKALS